IKLVGDSAAATGAPIEEMSQIFNRIQGTGKLMGTELDMIENRLTGFTDAMAESKGLSTEEFRKAVSNGEVSAEQFQKVMTERVGGVADLMAETWQGQVLYFKSFTAMLGEEALSEAFETAKKSLSSLNAVLSSDEALNFAEKIGQTLGEAINNTIEKIKHAIKWFTGLDTSTQKLIGKFALGAVAAGPFVLMFGKMVSAIGSILTVIGPVIGGLGGLFTGIANVTTGGKEFATVFPKLSGALTFITGPIGIAIAAIIGIGTAFTVAYAKSETFRNIVHSIIGVIQNVIQWFVEFNQAILALFQGDEDNGTKMLEKLGLSESMIEIISTQIEFVKQIFSTIFDTVSEVFTAVG